MSIQKVTEQDSLYDNLEDLSTSELVNSIHNEDKKICSSIQKVLPFITKLVDALVSKLSSGGRLFYLGAGTSGRLGVLDASECPPTFGTPNWKVNGIIAGGNDALHQSVEHAEDSHTQAWKDLCNKKINNKDFVIGIAASGTTPYVVEGLKSCNKYGILTGCICCNHNTPLANSSKFPIEAVVGPEFITGSTRMKAGTAQKMILNMITTSAMVKLGHIKGNKMIDMQTNNNKLKERAIRIIGKSLSISEGRASELFKQYGSIRNVIENHQTK
ncbi:MAG: N-acetylmuramic acid 6-phosphate etherase [Flavobacteriaceae bacterium]